jgi:hypothetical protein
MIMLMSFLSKRKTQFEDILEFEIHNNGASTSEQQRR